MTLKHCHICLQMTVTSLFCTIDPKNVNVAFTKINNDLTKLSEWSKQWRVTLNAAKSVHMIITRSFEERISQLTGIPETSIYESIHENIAALKKKEIVGLREEVSFLRSKLYDHTEVKKPESIETKQRIDTLEQDSKMNNLRIVGIPEAIDEDLQHKILDMIQQKLNLSSIGEADIRQCYRLGKANKAVQNNMYVSNQLARTFSNDLPQNKHKILY